MKNLIYCLIILNCLIFIPSGSSAQSFGYNGSLLQTILPVQQTIRFGNDLKAGVYLVKVYSEKNATTIKIIKK